jgi:hypothetical protein
MSNQHLSAMHALCELVVIICVLVAECDSTLWLYYNLFCWFWCRCECDISPTRLSQNVTHISQIMAFLLFINGMWFDLNRYGYRNIDMCTFGTIYTYMSQTKCTQLYQFTPIIHKTHNQIVVIICTKYGSCLLHLSMNLLQPAYQHTTHKKLKNINTVCTESTI